MALHEKVDHLQSEMLVRLLERQEELTRLIADLQKNKGA